MYRIDTTICKHCKQEIDVFFYFNSPRITTETNAGGMSHCYTAMTNARTVCPLCGALIEEVFQKTITPSDIIKIACQKESVSC